MVNKTTILVVLCVLLALGIVAQYFFFPREVVVTKIVTVEKPVETIKYIDRIVEKEVVKYRSCVNVTNINITHQYSSTVQPCSLTHNCTLPDDNQIRSQPGYRGDGQIRTQTGYR